MVKIVKAKYEYVFSLNSISTNDDVTVPPPPPPEPNKVIHFGPRKSDEEIVYGSKFNLNVDTLLNNSNTTRLAMRNRKDGTKKVPRRQNAWILYRRDKSVDPCFFGLKSSVVSKRLGEMWSKEPDDVKEIYAALARLSEAKHIEKHKNYKYKPTLKRPSSKNKKREARRDDPYGFELKFSEESQDKSNSHVMDDSSSTSSSFGSPEFEDIMDDINPFDTASTTSSPQISEFEEFITFNNSNSQEMINESNIFSLESASSSPTFEEYFLTLNNDTTNELNPFGLESTTSSTSSSPKSSDFEEFAILDNSDSQDVPFNFPSLDSIEYNNTITPPVIEFQQFTPLDQSYDIDMTSYSELMNDLSSVFLGSNFYENVETVENVENVPDDLENMLSLQLPLDYYGYIPEDNSIELLKGSGSLQ